LDFIRDRGFGTVVPIFETLANLFENPKLQATDQRGLYLCNYLAQLSCFCRAQQVKELANVAKVVLVRSQRKITVLFSSNTKINVIARQIETVGALLSV
jgi:hypothetical protein